MKRNPTENKHRLALLQSFLAVFVLLDAIHFYQSNFWSNTDKLSWLIVFWFFHWKKNRLIFKLAVFIGSDEWMVWMYYKNKMHKSDSVFVGWPTNEREMGNKELVHYDFYLCSTKVKGKMYECYQIRNKSIDVSSRKSYIFELSENTHTYKWYSFLNE